MIVDCAIYHLGRRTEGPEDLSDALDLARAEGDAFIWIGLYEPTEQEFDLVTEEFGLHPLAVEDALKAHQRPKLEMYDDSLFVVLKPVAYEAESDVVTTGEVMVFIGDAFVVTVRHGECSPLAQVRHAAGGGPRDAAARTDGGALLDRRRHGRPLPGGGDRTPDGPGGAGGGGLLAERRRFTAHRVQDLHVQAADPGVPAGHGPPDRSADPALGLGRSRRPPCRS